MNMNYRQKEGNIMALRIINYTCDIQTNRVFVLVGNKDYSDNLEVYVADASVFDANSTDPSILSWNKYIQQPLNFKFNKDTPFLVSVRYANNSLYIKDIVSSKVIVLPENDSIRPHILKINNNYHGNQLPEEAQTAAFHVFNDGTFLYGDINGLYYYKDRNPPLIPVLKTSEVPNYIAANDYITVVSVADETRMVFIANTLKKDTGNQKWVKVGLDIQGHVTDIFIDQANFIVNILTVPVDDSSSTGKMVLNRLSFKGFITPSALDPERLAPIDLNYVLDPSGFNSQLIGTIPDKDGLLISFIDSPYGDNNQEKEPKSIALLLKSKSNYDYELVELAANPIPLMIPDENEYDPEAQRKMFTPSSTCAFYLHMDATFYIAPGGSKNKFLPIQIEQINT